MKMHEDECSGPGIMCVDRGVLVGTRGAQGLGQGFPVRTLSASLVCVVLGFPLRFAAGEPGRSSTFRTCHRECSPHLPLFAGELLVGTHAAPSHVAVFAHMVPSIAPGRVSARLCKLLRHYPLAQDVGLGLGHGSAESWNVPGFRALVCRILNMDFVEYPFYALR